MAATIGSLKDQNAKMNMEQMQLSSYMNVILDDMETREQEIETICKETDIERELKDACCEHMSQVLRVKKDLIAQNLAYKSKIALLGCLLKETTRKCTDLASQFRSLQERIFKKNKSKRCERNTEEDPVMAEIECVEMKWTSQYRQTMEILHSVHVDFLPHESDDDDYASEFEEYAAGLDKQTGDASRTPKKPSKPDGNAQSLAACASGGQRLDDDSKGARAKTAAYKKGRGGGKGKKKKQQKGNRNNNYSTKRSESPEEEIDPFADVERVPKLPPECYVPPACPTDLDVTTAFRRMTIKDIKRIREKYLRKEF